MENKVEIMLLSVVLVFMIMIGWYSKLSFEKSLNLRPDQLKHIQHHWINHDSRLVTVLIDETLATGTDGACETAAQIFHAITSQGYRLHVLSPNGFVPSAMNPMDAQWTAQLANLELKY